MSDTATPGAGGGGEWIHGGGDGRIEVPPQVTCSGGWKLPPLCVSFGDDQEGQDNG